jgi:hypothetical protein
VFQKIGFLWEILFWNLILEFGEKDFIKSLINQLIDEKLNLSFNNATKVYFSFAGHFIKINAF